MIRSLILLFFVTTITNPSLSRKAGETEITTEDGIEVFQEEKYYLLKKNVEIYSDDLDLKGQNVKIFFNENLYDVEELVAKEKVSFNSKSFNTKGSGSFVRFNVKNQNITIVGIQSELFLEGTQMFSDEKISVDNINGKFLIIGPNSKLISEDIYINGSKINGSFEIINGKRDITNLIVEDEKKLNIKTDDINMFAKRAEYEKNKSVIELFEEVQISRGNEIINGDYGILNTEKNSYKVFSDSTKKVKAIILDSNE